MNAPATPRQKEFLRALGLKEVSELSKDQASELIDELLKKERASGKTFPCPYCKKHFGPRPRRREVKCSNCGETIVHLSGKFFTKEQAAVRYQKDWLKKERKNRNEFIRDEWQQEKQSRRHLGETYLVAYVLRAGTECPHAASLDGKLIRLEDAYELRDLFPPYDDCRYDTCKCHYDALTEDQIPHGTLVIRPPAKGKQTTSEARTRRPSASKSQSSRSSPQKTGCTIFILAILGVGATVLAMLIQ